MVTHYPLQQVRSPTDDLNRAVALRCLEICRDPQGASAEAVACAWNTIVCAMAGRESVAAALLEADVLEVAVAHLHESSAVEWINWRCAAGPTAGTIMGLAGQVAILELPGMDKVQLLVDCGMVDAIASLLKVGTRTRRQCLWSLMIRRCLATGVRAAGGWQTRRSQRLCPCVWPVGADPAGSDRARGSADPAAA